ncbi:MAG TPA: carboxypeptidase regulatory-like domain-containing protein [Anaeromyxobacter sp.]|nr:carboxypeptidase regulatory-like domain-containing protein [Anaeromyxobacter sp.]
MEPRQRNRVLALAAAAALVALLLAALLLRGGEGAPPAPGAATAGAPPAAPPAAGVPTRLPITIPAPSAPSTPDALPASFEGRVVSRASGQGVPGAELTFSRGGAAASVRAGPDGAFRFDPPATGRWLVAAVTAPGFLPFAPEWGHSPVQLDARPGLHVRGLVVHLVPATEIVGKVVDGERRPVEGAEVRLLGVASEAALVAIPDRFTSDALGEFRFVAPVGATLEARKAGLAPGRVELDHLASLARRVTIVLGPPQAAQGEPAAISGRVVARGAGPVAGALVLAEREPSFEDGALVAQAATGADGAFELRGLDPGRYRITARAEGRSPGRVRGVNAGARDVLVELGDGARLRGCVRDASSGAPVAPFTVLVLDRRAALFRPVQQSRSFVDASGCYAIDDLARGPAAVVVSAPGYAPSGEIAVDLDPAREAVADAAVERGGRLAGVVLDLATRQPLRDARISVEGALIDAASTFPVLAEATTDADGRFVLEGLPSRFSISAAAADHHARVVGGLEAAPARDAPAIEIALRPVAPGEEPRTELAGIGVVIAPRGETLVVTGVAPGGGAAEVGLGPGDAILRVNGEPVTELGFAGAVSAIRGPEGTIVLLTIRRGDRTLEVRVPRRLVRG